MKIISHRGNLNGKSLYENHPEYIQETFLKTSMWKLMFGGLMRSFG